MTASHPAFNPRPVFCSMCAWTGDHSEARPFQGGPVIPSGMEVTRFCPDCGEQVQDGDAPTTDTHFLYAAALAADRRFSAALKKAFGRDACNRRYDADNSAHPAEVREACAEYQTASERWREAFRAAQQEQRDEDAEAARFGTPAEEVGDVVGVEVDICPASDSEGRPCLGEVGHELPHRSVAEDFTDDTCACGSPFPHHLANLGLPFTHVCKCERRYRVVEGRFVADGLEANPFFASA